MEKEEKGKLVFNGDEVILLACRKTDESYVIEFLNDIQIGELKDIIKQLKQVERKLDVDKKKSLYIP